MKKCKYHCDYGDGENCHYEGESGCVNIEQPKKEIKLHTVVTEEEQLKQIKNGFKLLLENYNHCFYCKGLKLGKMIDAKCCDENVKIFVCNDCIKDR